MKPQRAAQLKALAAELRHHLTKLHHLEADLDIMGWVLNQGPDVVEAMERIEAGTYGICIDCEDEISLARLHARPTATRCVQCQRNNEQHSEMVLRVRLAL